MRTKSKMYIAAATILAALLLTACNCDSKKAACDDETKAEKTEAAGTAVSMYTCSMHPEVMQDSAGICPKCDMTLVKKADE